MSDSAGLPPVVLLPGMMLDGRAFQSQQRALERLTTTLVGDISRSASIEAMAEDVLREAPPRFAVAGLSLGGIVALEIWRRAPGRITHLALLDTTPFADKPQRRALRLEQIAQVEAGLLEEVLVRSMKPLYLARCNRADRALLRSIVDQALDLGPDVFRRQSLALRDRCDRSDVLRTIECPSLVLCGREDDLCPVDYHTSMAAAMPRADLVVLADCGHLSPMEQPQAVCWEFERLLRRPS